MNLSQTYVPTPFSERQFHRTEFLSPPSPGDIETVEAQAGEPVEMVIFAYGPPPHKKMVK